MSVQRKLVSLLLAGLIALQSLAAIALPCAMPTDAEGTHPTVVDHSLHAGHAGHGTSSSETATDSTDADCCDDGYCSQNGCITLMFLLPAAECERIDVVHAGLPSPRYDLPDWSPNSRFRPPSV